MEYVSNPEKTDVSSMIMVLTHVVDFSVLQYLFQSICFIFYFELLKTFLGKTFWVVLWHSFQIHRRSPLWAQIYWLTRVSTSNQSQHKVQRQVFFFITRVIAWYNFGFSILHYWYGLLQLFQFWCRQFLSISTCWIPSI